MNRQIERHRMQSVLAGAALFVVSFSSPHMTTAQVLVQVRTSYVDDIDLLIIEDGVEQALHEREWVSLAESDEDYDVWLSDWQQANDSTKRDLSVLVELRATPHAPPGRQVYRRRVFFRTYWRDMRQYAPEYRSFEGTEPTSDLVEASKRDLANVASIVAYFNGRPFATGVLPADSLSAGIPVSVAESFASFRKRTATKIELYERVMLTGLVVSAVEEMLGLPPARSAARISSH